MIQSKKSPHSRLPSRFLHPRRERRWAGDGFGLLVRVFWRAHVQPYGHAMKSELLADGINEETLVAFRHVVPVREHGEGGRAGRHLRSGRSCEHGHADNANADYKD